MAYCVEKPAGLEYAYSIFRRGVAMMGQQTGGQEKLFYAFNLEQVVPAKHLLRSIDRCLDLSDLRQHLSDFYSHTGRPSIDPELMIRMLIVGYCYGRQPKLSRGDSTEAQGSGKIPDIAGHLVAGLGPQSHNAIRISV
jgi:hypothetical protein